MTAAPVQAVIFDFDGVLVESLQIKKDVFASLFESFGPALLDKVMAYYALNEGISRLVKARHCYREFLARDLAEDELEAINRTYTERALRRVVECDWVPGAEAFLAAHRGRLRMFTASGTPEEELRRIAAERRMDHYFDRVCGSPRSKAEIIETLIADYGLDRTRCVMVGDAMADYRGARETGIRFIGRVVPGHASRFPPGTETLPDLTSLADRLAG